MPLLQYYCKDCDKHFEELVRKYDVEVVCPACKKPAQRDYSGSVYTATGKPAVHCSGNCKTCSGCK